MPLVKVLTVLRSQHSGSVLRPATTKRDATSLPLASKLQVALVRREGGEPFGLRVDLGSSAAADEADSVPHASLATRRSSATVETVAYQIRPTPYWSSAASELTIAQCSDWACATNIRSEWIAMKQRQSLDGGGVFQTDWQQLEVVDR